MRLKEERDRKRAYQLRNQKFTDTTFPTSDAIYWRDHEVEKDSLVASYSVRWKRLGDRYPNYSLWGPSGVIPNDIA